MKRKRVCQSLWAAALVVLSAGCVKEPYPGGGTGGSSGFTLTAVAESMSPEGVITRASDPKTAAECEIRTLHVFLFGPDGNYLGTREGHRIFQGYQQSGSPTLHIDAGGFSDPAAAASATVYVVANVEPGTFGAISAEGYPEKIRNKADFDAFYYQPTRREDLSELPEAGMPMFGMDTLDLTQADGSVVVELKALMARVDFSFRVEAPGGTIGGLPSLVLTECEVRNVPTRVPFVPLAEDAESNLDADGDGQADATTSRVVYIDPSTGPLRNQQGEAEFSFYVYETKGTPDMRNIPASIRILRGSIRTITSGTNRCWPSVRTTIRFRLRMPYSRACLPMRMTSTIRLRVPFSWGEILYPISIFGEIISTATMLRYPVLRQPGIPRRMW